MELPKNIVQIGKPDKLHKIFVEDYVISYIKQLNRHLNGRTAGLAFYGKRYTEDNVRYYFLYGAAQVLGIEGRGQYLSELEREGIEEKQREYFEAYDFLAWCSISGELPEGFYLHEQGKGLLIDGYACFYEKNECMLNFMIHLGQEQKERESEQEVFRGRLQEPGNSQRLTPRGNIDRRMEEKQKPQAPENPGTAGIREGREDTYRRQRAMMAARGKITAPRSGFRFAVVIVGILLFILGFMTFSDEERMKELQVVAKQVIKNLSEQKLPNIGEEIDDPKKSTEMTNPEQQEPETRMRATEGEAQSQVSEDATDQDSVAESGTQTGETGGSIQNPESQPPAQEPDLTGQAETPPVVQESQPGPVEETVQTTVTYVIQKGDTLLDICRKKYGTVERLKEICELNGIENADDIKMGQIILLPE